MKTLLFFSLILLGLREGVRANRIDELQTKEEVKKFLIHRVSNQFKDYDLFGQRPRSDSNALSNQFFRLDMNADGLTDLVVYSGRLWVIIDKGNDAYSVFEPSRRSFEQGKVLDAIDSSGPVKKLLLHDQTFGAAGPGYTLAWQSGGFMEYNPAPAEHLEFQGIKVSTTPCFGKCPIFEMTVGADGKAWYNAIRFNKEEGKFTGTVPAKELEAMQDLLRWLSLENLKNEYEVEWTDDQTISVEIKYDGNVKRISDYGEQGTFGLRRLYAFFWKWKKEVEWVRE